MQRRFEQALRILDEAEQRHERHYSQNKVERRGGAEASKVGNRVDMYIVTLNKKVIQ